MFPSLVVNMRWRESSFLDPEDCEEPSLVKLVKKIQVLTLSAFTVQGCILETGAEKSVSNAQDSPVGAMKSVRVDDWKTFLCFFWNIE